jgi:MFS family permease
MTAILCTLAVFCDMLIYGLVIPLFPRYAEHHGATPLELGALFGSYGLALLVAAPLVGRVVDRYGARAVLLAGLGGLAVTTVGYGMAASFALLLVARTLQGLAAAGVWIAGLALVAQSYEGAARARALSTSGLGSATGTLIGPPAGGALAERLAPEAPFVVAAAMALVLLAVCWRLLPRPTASTSTIAPSHLLDELAWFFGVPGALAVSAVVLAGALCVGALEAVLSLHLGTTLGLSAELTGFAFMGMTLGYGLCAPLAGHLTGALGFRRVVMWGGFATTAVLTLILPLREAWSFYVWMTGVGMALSFFVAPTLNALASLAEHDGGNRFGLAYAIYNVLYAAGLVIGPLVGGHLLTVAGVEAVCLAAAAAIAGAAVVAARGSVR